MKSLPPLDISYKRKRSLVTVPDQALTVKEIFRRFAKGVPVDQVSRDPVYLNQDLYDYEALSRMSFDEKVQLADELADRAQAIRSELEAREAERVTEERQKSERYELWKKAQDARKHSTGIDPLDNTMPVDTNQTTK